MVTLHERLRWLRKQRGYTLQQVAQQADISLSFLSDVERGQTLPTLRMVERIARVFGLSVGELLVGVEIEPERDSAESEA